MRLVPLTLIALLLALGACDGADDLEDGFVEITLLVAYTTQAAAQVGDVEAHLARGIDDTNLVYANSGIDARLVPVHVSVVDYEVQDRFQALRHLVWTDDGVLDELHPLRDEHEADVVVLVSSTPGSTINASIMAVPENAFLIVETTQLGAPGYGLAHEMGHLHGARHYSADDPLMEPFPYGHAFRNDSLHTVLTWGTPKKVPFFSGPGSVYEGVVMGDSTLHDNARVIRETAVYLSNFRGPQTPTDFVSPGTWPTLPDL